MSYVNPLAVALQGLFPLTPIAAAAQGLIEDLSASGQPASGYAKSHVNAKRSIVDMVAEDQPFKAYVDMLNAEFQRKSRIAQDDQLAIEFIAALVQSEILYGTQ